jgi:hypothetical protein
MVNIHASALGKLGGKAKSEKKTLAVRLNGKKGSDKRWEGHVKKLDVPLPIETSALQVSLENQSDCLKYDSQNNEKSDLDI